MLSVYDREDATFDYPSMASTAQYCIRFWSSVRIPDGVYGQFGFAHESQRVATVSTDEGLAATQTAADDAFDEWVEANPADGEDAELSDAQWKSVLKTAHDNYAGKAMDPRDTPVIARAALMFHNAPGEQFGDEREEVLGFQVELVGGSTTVADIVETYRTEDVYWAVSTVPRKEETDQSGLLQAIQGLQQSVESMANNSNFTELSSQQSALLDAMKESTELLKPMASIANIKLQEMKSTHLYGLQLNGKAMAEEATERRIARGGVR